jgi:anti-anti-sigma factor
MPAEPAGGILAIERIEGGFRLVGEIDLSSVDQFREAIREAGRASPELVLDLSECTFLGSEGIGVLIEATQALDGGRLILRSPNDMVSKVLDVAGLTRMPSVRVESG